MFTGIIQEIGTVKKIQRKNTMSYLEIECKKILENIAFGDSVAVNGVCLSVVKQGANFLGFDVVANTLNATNLKRLKTRSKVNLESALKMGDNVGGHMVSGHIDYERVIKKNKKTAEGWILEVDIKNEDKQYVIQKGSISIDGVSLTIGEVGVNSIKIFLIPHTIENTILFIKKSGDYVNVEFDTMGKFAAKDNRSAGRITKEMLNRNGFM